MFFGQEMCLFFNTDCPKKCVCFLNIDIFLTKMGQVMMISFLSDPDPKKKYALIVNLFFIYFLYRTYCRYGHICYLFAIVIILLFLLTKTDLM